MLAYLRGLSTSVLAIPLATCIRMAGLSIGLLPAKGKVVSASSIERRTTKPLKWASTFARGSAQFGDESPELAYVDQLISYCNQHGVVRKNRN
ncbi:hypothetical protein [Pseudomonas aeruginosa]|uniref:hypothetical protein n=1 Tax=Pseudomonas aeruginosa TaxID=287 RepID=UPI00397E33D1